MTNIVVEAISGDRIERHRIIDDGNGMGGLMCPPGHVNHRYSYQVDRRSSNRGRWIESVLAPIGSIGEDAPTVVRAEADQLIACQELVCSQAWVEYVYGYFRNCYFPGSLDVRQMVDTGRPEQHGGYLRVRKYFPDHSPRTDLIESGGAYGSWPCRVCGERVQYEARIDAFGVPGASSGVCAGKGPHEPEKK